VNSGFWREELFPVELPFTYITWLSHRICTDFQLRTSDSTWECQELARKSFRGEMQLFTIGEEGER